MVDFDVCNFDDKPCFLFVSKDDEWSCLLRNIKGEVSYACVRIRFKGKNSARARDSCDDLMSYYFGGSECPPYTCSRYVMDSGGCEG